MFVQPENECRISIHEEVNENLIFQIRLAALDDQRVNNSVTLEMLTHEKVISLKFHIVRLTRYTTLLFVWFCCLSIDNNRLSVCRLPTECAGWLAKGYRTSERTRSCPSSKWPTLQPSYQNLVARRPPSKRIRNCGQLPPPLVGPSYWLITGGTDSDLPRTVITQFRLIERKWLFLLKFSIDWFFFCFVTCTQICISHYSALTDLSQQ